MAFTTTALPARKHTTLRVLVLDQGPGLWGAQQYLLRLRPLLAEHGVELTLACPPELEQYEHWRSRGLPVIPLALPVSRSIRDETRISAGRLTTEIRRSVAVPRLIAQTAVRGRYDLVLANSHWTHLDAAVAARMWRLPTVLTLHETSMPGVGRRLRDMAVRAAGHTIAVSGSVAETVGAAVRERVTVIPNGVDTTVFAPSDERLRRTVRRELGIDDDRRVALAATRIDPSKHIEDLVEFAAGLDDSVTVLVAGTTSAYGDYEQRVRELATALSPGRMRFLGARDDIPRLLGASDLYVHTGLIEGMPLGVIEAQAAGVPVVAYEAAGVREAVRHGETGYVVAPRDTVGLRDAGRRVFGSESLRRRLGEQARSHVLDRHRLDDQAAANAELLREVCWSPTPSPVAAAS
ncbi:glycosyltransferase family 4 protein [Gordonia sp. PKS22-38]|uniref:Glycosyltransferase family 4 protein n=1 Tax=Gordonia prachuapensis TaxID=3115651 RepID=A0ABU7MYJ3_9ACTN|nr:glycosyltransferase family 4 protein [Gordonia sp. PKS22-38]